MRPAILIGAGGPAKEVVALLYGPADHKPSRCIQRYVAERLALIVGGTRYEAGSAARSLCAHSSCVI
ncbi:UNVERIFIED_CONTAM: hypothetical protein DES50_101257 [Williamsia faeni]